MTDTGTTLRLCGEGDFIKIGIFTDSHYSSQEITCGCRYNSRSLQKIGQAYDAFEAEKCDLVICLGDLIDKEDSHTKETENLKKVAQVINRSRIPTVCLMGNHDAFAFGVDEFYGILGDCVPKDVTAGDRNLLFLDACHFKSGAHYKPGDSDWTDTYYPEEEVLKDKLADIEGDVYLFLHQNIDASIPEDHRLFNADKLCEIIQNCGKVKAVYQGHYHAGSKSEHGGVEYVTFPAMCQNEAAYFMVTL